MRLPAFLALVLGLFCSSVTVASASSGYDEYVALGDSWSADTTLMLTNISTDGVPLGCAQATYNYPKQVAAALGVARFRDATCGSATTVELTTPQSVPLGGVNPAQFDRLTPTTDLVTLGIGGNDAGLAGAVAGCIRLLLPPLSTPCKSDWVSGGVDRMSRQIAQAGQNVAAAIDGIRARSPRAKVLLVDYLARLPKVGCWPYQPILNEDVPWLRAKLVELNQTLAQVATAKGARLLDTFTSSQGHDACQLPGTNWIEGVLPVSTTPLGLMVPFHPNQLGANHQAAVVLRALGVADGA
jgi:lysophospholipase L1-like esterase